MQYVDLAHRASKRKNRTTPVVLTIIFLILMGIIGAVVYGVAKVTKLNPVEIYTKITQPVALKSDDGFTNILLLGTDTRSSGEGSQEFLTDTILAVSINPTSGKILMTSIPRDFYTPGSPNEKINNLYAASGKYVSKVFIGDPTATEAQASKILGIPIHYYVVVDFASFTKAIDILGGVDVVVPQAYADYNYPIAGREASTCGLSQADADQQVADAIAGGEDPAFRFTCRFKILNYKVGPLHLEGAGALEFARSRHGAGPLGTDFGRARRQQLVMEGIKAKLLSSSTFLNLGKIEELYKNFHDSIQTNVDLTELQAFLSAFLKLKNVSPQSLVLSSWAGQEDGGGILLDGYSDVGGYVEVPKAGRTNYSEIQNLIRTKLTTPDNLPIATPSAKPTTP